MVAPWRAIAFSAVSYRRDEAPLDHKLVEAGEDEGISSRFDLDALREYGVWEPRAP